MGRAGPAAGRVGPAGHNDAMTAQLLAGAPVADAVLADVAERVAALRSRGKGVGLGTILVGADAASAGYVRKKHETCEQVGIASHHIDVPGDGTQADLLAAVERFNADEEIQQIVSELRTRGAEGGIGETSFSAEGAEELKGRQLDLPAIRAQGYPYERLDQLTMEILLGVR